jgi:hypothetical protein
MTEGKILTATIIVAVINILHTLDIQIGLNCFELWTPSDGYMQQIGLGLFNDTFSTV